MVNNYPSKKLFTLRETNKLSTLQYIIQLPVSETEELKKERYADRSYYFHVSLLSMAKWWPPDVSAAAWKKVMCIRACICVCVCVCRRAKSAASSPILLSELVRH